MKAKISVILLDVLIAIIMIISLTTKSLVRSELTQAVDKTPVGDSSMSFNFIPDPVEKKVKAGETVTVKLNVEDINVGEEGLNSIVGYLSYDESVFDKVTYKAADDSDWKLEHNTRKGHSMYGKFCLYTMQEGVTDNQQVATLVLKLKDDLKPQTTKIYFTNLASSDGDKEVFDEDRVVTLIIYEDEAEIPDEPEPEKKTPEKPAKSIQTGDKIGMMVILAILAVMINILVFAGKNKIKTFSIILVTIIGVSSLGTVAKALNGGSSIADIISSLDYKQSWLNSEDYLVTDTTVSRFFPETNIDSVTNKFNKNIDVDTTGTRAPEGKLATGMKFSVNNPTKVDADGDRAYTVSVWGDTNNDSYSNQVELTTIIRNTLDSEKWSLSDERYLSADVTVDDIINEDDVDASVKYIVYGELEIPGFEQVEEPSISVIGEYDEDLECYTSNTVVRITENEEDAKNTKYKIENSEGEVIPFTEIERTAVDEDGKVIKQAVLDMGEIYKVSAYTTGKLGNRSEIPYVIVNVGNTEKRYNYTIEYYYEQELENGPEFVLDEDMTKTDSAIYGSVLNNLTDLPKYVDGARRGYEIATEVGTNGVVGLPLTIGKDVSQNKVKIYYKATEYAITYNLNDNGDAVCEPNPEYYKVTLPDITLNNPTRYGFEFEGWTGTDLTGKTETVVIPHGSIGEREYTANWIRKTGGMYKFEYYLENLDGGYNDTPDESTTFNDGTIGDTKEIPEVTFDGFTEDTTNENRKISGTIEEDTVLVLKRYYTRNEYNLTVIADDLVVEGNQILTADAVGNGHIGDGVQAVQALDDNNDPIPNTKVAKYKHGQPVDVSATVAEVTGYTTEFTEWTSDTNKVTPPTTANGQITMPIGDVTLTAKGTSRINQYGYTVNYYFDNELRETKDDGTADYNTTISYPSTKAPDISQGTGYAFSKYVTTDGEDTPLTVRADASQNVINVYYVSNSGNLIIHHYKDGETTNVKLAEDETISMEYGASFEVTPLFANNKIKVNGTDVDMTRAYLDVNACQLSRVVVYTGATEGENGVVTGTAASDMGEISYYYTIASLQVTGEVIGGNGTISLEGNPIYVNYGEDVEDDIVITPARGYDFSSGRLYSGSEIDGEYDDTDGVSLATMRVGKKYCVNLSQLCDIRENKHIVVRFAESRIVCVIVGVPTGLEDLRSDNGGHVILNHEYETLEAAIMDAQQANEAKDPNTGNVEIRMLADVNETNVIDYGNDVIIDLNGHVITSNSSTVPTIGIEGGSLNIIDRSVIQTGKVESTEREAIAISSVGTLTLGTNEEDGYPSVTTPRIEGQTNGINKDPDGTFNFYDGLIVGHTGSAVTDLTVDDTPGFYKAHADQDPTDPSVSIEYLAVPAEIVAMIGTEEFHTLEAAFDRADQISTAPGFVEGTNIEIELVQDYMLENEDNEAAGHKIIRIAADKNYTLDLNGHVISAKNVKNMFVNNGQFEIKDSSASYYDDYEMLELVNDSDYYFEKRGDYLATNDTWGSVPMYYSQAERQYIIDHFNHSYVEIDLSDVSPDVTKTLYIDGQGLGKDLRWYVTESAETPEFKYLSPRPTFEKEIELEGGKTYYLHLLAGCTSNVIDKIDTAIITDLKLDGRPILADVISPSGAIVGNGNNYLASIVNNADAKLVINNAKITSGKLDNYGELDLNHSDIGTAISNYNEVNVNGGILRSGFGGANISGQPYVDKATVQGGTYAIGAVQGTDLTANELYCTGSVSGGKALGLAPNITGSGSGSLKNIDCVGMTLVAGTAEDSVINGQCQIGTKDGVTTLKNSKVLNGQAVITSGDVTLINDEINGTITNYGNTVFKSGTLAGVRSASATVATNNYGEFTLEDGTLTGNVLNKYDANGTTLKIVGGTINGQLINSDKNYNANPDAVIIIGTKNTSASDEVSETVPTINAIGTYGISNAYEGQVYFYDGQVISGDGQFVQGALTAIEDGTYIMCDDYTTTVNEQEVNGERTYLSKTGRGVARIADTTNITIPAGITTKHENGYYIFSDLNDAINSCNNNAATIEIIASTVIPNGQSTITSGKDITIDLKGNTIRYLFNEAAVTVNEGGKLTIKDSDEGGIITNYGSTIDNNGTLNVDSGKVTNNGRIGTYVTVVANKGTMNVNGGTVAQTTSNTEGTIENTGTLSINDGTINGGVHNKSNGKFNINGGFVDGYTIIRNEDTATINMTGGMIHDGKISLDISVRNIGIQSSSTADTVLTMTGGKIGATVNIENDSKVRMAGPEGSVDNYAYIRELHTSGHVYADHADIGRADIKNYASISNSVVGGTINNTTENITTISNSEIALTLKGTGTTNITDTRVNSLSNEDECITTIDNTNAGDKILYSNYDSIGNKGSGTLTITNAKFGHNYGESLVNSGSGTLILQNVTPVQNGTMGVRNEGSGEIRINSGCVLLSSGTPVNNNGSGTIYVGDKNAPVNTTTPDVKSTGSYATSQAGNGGSIVFANGRITAPENNVFYGGITPRSGLQIGDLENPPEGYQVKILISRPVAKIKTTEATVSGMEPEDGYYLFYSLQEAIDACNANGTIYVVADISVSEAVEVANNDNIIIDTNGKTVSFGGECGIINKGTLKLINSEENNEGSMELTGLKMISNEGTLTIDDINLVSNSSAATADTRAIVIENKGTLNVINNTSISTDKSFTTLVDNEGTANITDSKLYGKYWDKTLNGTSSDFAINNRDNGTVTVNTSEIKYGLVVNNDDGTVNLNSSFLNGSGIRNGGIDKESATGSATMTIAGGTIAAGVITTYSETWYSNTYNYSGTLTYKDGTSSNLVVVTWNGYNGGCIPGIVNDGGTIKFESGRIIGGFTNNEGTMEVLGGHVSGGYTNAKDGTLKIVDGTVDGAECYAKTDGITYTDADYKNGNITIDDPRGINGALNNAGTLIIGDKSNAVNSNVPTLDMRGSISNATDATFNFYDGKIIINNTIQNTINEIPSGASILHTSEDVNSQTLHTYQVSNTTPVARIVGGSDYMSLTDAFNHATNGDEIELLATIALSKDDVYTIPANTSIKFNLGNNSITYNGTSTLFTNNGTFELTGGADGTLYTYGDILVENTGAFTLSGGTYDIINSGVQEENTFIKNTGAGTVVISGGKIINDSFQNEEMQSRGAYIGGYAIYSTSSGNVTINGGEIISSGSSYNSPFDARIHASNWIKMIGGATNKGTQLNISGNAKITGGTNVYTSSNSVGSIHNVTFNMTGGEIDMSTLALTRSEANITGGTFTGTLIIPEYSNINVDDTASISSLEVGGIGKIYGGSVDSFKIDGNYQSYTAAQVEIDGSKGTQSDRVSIGTISNIRANTTIKDTDITGGLSVNDLGEKAGSRVDILEGVNITTSGDAITCRGGSVYIEKTNTVITSTDGNGLVIIGQTGSGSKEANVYLGVEDASVSRVAPVITGKLSGITHNGVKAKLHWFDGVAICSDENTATNLAYKSDAGTLIVPSMFEGYYGVREENNGKKAYIGPAQGAAMQVKIDDTTFPTLQAAIDHVNQYVSSKTATIVLLETITVTEQVVIPSGCNITLELQGHSIGIFLTNEIIKVSNGATLTITDSLSTGKIENRNGSVINVESGATLNLQINQTNIVPKDGEPAITGGGTVNNN